MNYPNFSFTYETTPWGRARHGVLKTPHGDIETPNFIFCATKASIKGVSPLHLRELGTQVILSNTYHLMLRPGANLIEERGGLHTFMNHNLPMLTDSGGYQIFAMGYGSVSQEIKRKATHSNKTLLKIDEEGATFKSYYDGSLHRLTPEKSMEIQRKLGADLVVQLDECTPFRADKHYTSTSMEMSLRWGERSLAAFLEHNDGRQALYSVMQGGVHEDLREKSAQTIASQPFFGSCIGGSLGENEEQMHRIVSLSAQLCPPERPIHLLGIGGLKDIFHGVLQGIDTFDCVSPTRIARHGWAIVPHSVEPRGRLNLLNGHFATDDGPLDPSGRCSLTHSFSRAYLHHLFRTHELLGIQILSMHNIYQMNRMMGDIRVALKQGDVEKIRRFWVGY